MRMFQNGPREVPLFCDREELIRELHDWGGHIGSSKLYDALRGAYYWPNMFEDCVKCVASCTSCLTMRGRARPLPLKPTNKFSRPFACWSIDYLPKLPVSAEGYGHVLICVDVFSKWTELFAMKTKNSGEVW